MGRITADTYRRLYLLYVLGQFPKGSYGLLRLHKVTYVSERELHGARPFEFRRNHFGQYSDSMEDIKDQLLAMGLIGVEPLDTARITTLVVGGNRSSFQEGGNRLFLVDRGLLPHFAEALDAVFPDLSRRVSKSIENFVTLQQDELIRRCYAFPEFRDIALGETIFSSDLGDYVDVQLSDDECADLELELDPRAAPSLLRLLEAVESSDFDMRKVGYFDLHLSAP